jgi:hypothetical protein
VVVVLSRARGPNVRKREKTRAEKTKKQKNKKLNDAPATRAKGVARAAIFDAIARLSRGVGDE